MEVKIFSKEVVREAERVLKSFYMIGFNDSNRDAGEEQFGEQMGYPRNEPHGDLSFSAKQAVLALQIAREEADCHIPDSERTVKLEEQIEYLRNTFIEPIEERRDSRLMLPADAISKPKWLTPKIQEMVSELWRTENVDNSNPKVKALQLVQRVSEDAGYNIGIKMASEIIKQHCL